MPTMRATLLRPHQGMRKGKKTGRTLGPVDGSARRPTPPDTGAHHAPARAARLPKRRCPFRGRPSKERQRGGECAGAASHGNRSARGTSSCHRSQAPPRPRSDSGRRSPEPTRRWKTQWPASSSPRNAATRTSVTEQLPEVEQQPADEAPADFTTDERKLVRTVRALIAHLQLPDTACKLHKTCEARQHAAPRRLDVPLDNNFAECTTDTAMPPQLADTSRDRKQETRDRRSQAQAQSVLGRDRACVTTNTAVAADARQGCRPQRRPRRRPRLRQRRQRRARRRRRRRHRQRRQRRTPQ